MNVSVVELQNVLVDQRERATIEATETRLLYTQQDTAEAGGMTGEC